MACKGCQEETELHSKLDRQMNLAKEALYLAKEYTIQNSDKKLNEVSEINRTLINGAKLTDDEIVELKECKISSEIEDVIRAAELMHKFLTSNVDLDLMDDS